METRDEAELELQRQLESLTTTPETHEEVPGTEPKVAPKEEPLVTKAQIEQGIEYARKFLDENTNFQKVLTEKLSRETQVPLTKEELEKKKNEAFTKFFEDPEGTLKELVGKHTASSSPSTNDELLEPVWEMKGERLFDAVLKEYEEDYPEHSRVIVNAIKDAAKKIVSETVTDNRGKNHSILAFFGSADREYIRKDIFRRLDALVGENVRTQTKNHKPDPKSYLGTGAGVPLEYKNVPDAQYQRILAGCRAAAMKDDGTVDEKQLQEFLSLAIKGA